MDERDIENKIFDTLDNAMDIITKTIINMNYALERAEKRMFWYRIFIILFIIAFIIVTISYNVRDVMITRSYFNQTYENSIYNQDSIITQSFNKGD